MAFQRTFLTTRVEWILLSTELNATFSDRTAHLVISTIVLVVFGLWRLFLFRVIN